MQPPLRTSIPRARARDSSSATRRDFPMPVSPTTSAALARTFSASSRARSSSASSVWRSTRRALEILSTGCDYLALWSIRATARLISGGRAETGAPDVMRGSDRDTGPGEVLLVGREVDGEDAVIGVEV